MNPTQPPAAHTPGLSVHQGQYPAAAIVRLPDNSPDGPVKIAAFYHTASFDAWKMADQFVREHNSYAHNQAAIRALVEVCQDALSALDSLDQFPLIQEKLRAALALARGGEA